uniref:NADH-ubiquinone oxidoreductase chain 6 n=1 Tax=Histeroidea sp. 2 KM-2017 TaxID=2219435 RepID=A0A346RG79_9COLE|nr:NADH dehydrogenase subunit 6 [Histeroidea sp. 2 KM-2017]
MSTFLMLIPILSIIFMVMSHPLSMALILLLQTALIAIQSGLINFNYWFSYIMFLIMVGGMLVLFIYMTSVASNEKFSIKPQTILTYTVLFMTLMILSPTNNFIPMETLSNLWHPLKMISITKYMNFPNSSLVVLLMSYLLIALIAIVKICNIKYGPLRQKF